MCGDFADDCAIELIVDVLEVKGNGLGMNGMMDEFSTTDWHSSANRLLVSGLIWYVSTNLNDGGGGGGSGGGAGTSTDGTANGTDDRTGSGTHGADKVVMIGLSKTGVAVT